MLLRGFTVRTLCVLAAVLSLPAFASADYVVSLYQETTANSQIPGALRRYDETTGAYLPGGSVPPGGMVNSPASLAVGPDGLLYVANSGDGSVARFNAQTSAFVDYAIQPDPTSFPSGLAFDSTGNLFVANLNGNVDRYNKAGTGYGIGVPVLTAQNFPAGLAFDSTGALYVSEGAALTQPNLGSIVKLDANTLLPTTIVPAGGTFGGGNLAIGPDGLLYATDINNGTLLRFTLTGTPADASPFATFVLGDLSESPSGITFDNQGRILLALLGPDYMSSGSLIRLSADGQTREVIVSGLALASSVVITAVPEPATLALAGTGLVALGVVARRRRRVA